MFFDDKIKINYDLIDDTGTINVGVWQETLANMLRASTEQIWQVYESCDPDASANAAGASQAFAHTLNGICNLEKMFLLKCTLWNGIPRFTIVRVDVAATSVMGM